MTTEEYRQYLRAKAMRKHTSKYGAVKTDGYDSRHESRRASQLRIMLQAGLISDLREQVPFILIDAQLDDKGGILERPCRYIADFVYTDTKSGRQIVEDTKGFRTPEYIIKRKLMLSRYGIRIKET